MTSGVLFFMKIVQPIEIVSLVAALSASVFSWLHLNSLQVTLMVAILGFVITLLMVCYRIVSYIIAFLTEVAPSFAVVREFLKKFGT
jgi:small-conductance mechanosensitive channel